MKQILLKTWLILVCLLTGAGTMWAEEVVYKTAAFTKASFSAGVQNYTSSFSSTTNDFQVDLANFNNNNNGWNYVRTGNKTNASVGTITTNSAIDKAITKVVVTIDAVTASSVNSITLYSGASASSCTTSEGTFSASTGAQSVTISAPAANKFYKISFDCKKGSSNGLVQVSKVEYYVESGGSTPDPEPTKYTVTVDNNIANGTVTADPTSATAGTEVTLTATPSTGYEFGSWNVTDASSNAITVTDNKFTMPAANVNVSATFNAVQGGGDEPSGDGTVTFDFTTNSWSFPEGSANKATTDATFTNGTYTIALGNASTSGYYFNTEGYLILGKNGATLTLPAFDFDVERIVVYGRSSASPSVGQNIYVGENAVSTSTTGAQSSNTYEIASAYQAAGNVYVLKVTTSANTQITKIEVYAKEGTDPDQPEKTTPKLSFANPTYNATMGEDFTAPTLTNEKGVTVSYSSSKTDVATVNSETGVVTLVAPGTTKITASFAGNETYNEASASYTLEVAAAPAPALMTMDEIYAKAQEVNGTETEVRVTLNNWVVSGVNDSNAYVTDGTKGFIIYKSGHNFVAGDILSGTVSAKIKLFNGAAEFTTITSTTDGLTVTKGGSVSEQAIAIADLAGINTGALVAYEGLTYHLNGTSAEFSDGENVIVAYKGIMNALPELVEGKTYDVKGIFLMYGTKKEILPRYAEDVVLKENINNYTISYATTENGTIVVKNGDTPLKDGAEVAEGTKLTIECTPVSEDYRFVNWQYKEEGMDAFATRTKDFTYTMPSANVQFKANFELIPVYDVTYMSLGKVAGSEKVKEGEKIANAPSVTLTDWDFVGWTTNESYTDSETSPVLFNDVIKASITLYAVFSQGENGVAGSASLTNQEICDNVAGSYADGSITNTYGTWNYNAAKQGNVSKDGEYFLQLRNNATISYLQIPEMAGNITSIVLGRVCNTSKAQYTGSIYFRSEKSNDATAIATATQSTALTDVTLTIPDGYKTGYVMVSGACRIESVTVNYTTGGSKTYTITGPLPAVLSISEAGYATYYNAYPYVMPEGLTGLTMEPNGNNGIKGEARYAAGDVVPAETALLIKGAKNDYTLNVASEEGETYKDNLLHGLLVEGTTTGGGEGAKYYKFSNGDHGYGWYYHGSTNTTGAPFTIAANKAYLVLESNMTSSSARFIAIDGEDTLTAIDGLDTDVTNTEIYDLAGRRVQRVNNGMYILNGKKVIF